MQELSISMKRVGVQWRGACQDISPKEKDKLLHMVPHTIKKEASSFTE